MLHVRVHGWSTPRTIREENGKVLFEVAEADGCWTCLMRIERVYNTLRRKKIAAEFRTMPSAYGERCQYVVLDAPPQGVDIKHHVGQLLDLQIS